LQASVFPFIVALLSMDVSALLSDSVSLEQFVADVEADDPFVLEASHHDPRCHTYVPGKLRDGGQRLSAHPRPGRHAGPCAKPTKAGPDAPKEAAAVPNPANQVAKKAA
jgi:hypothetical protein